MNFSAVIRFWIMFLCISCTIFCAVKTFYDQFFTVSAWLWLDLHYAMLEFIFRFLSNSLLQVSAMEKEWIRPKIPKLYHISCKTLAVKAGIYKFEISIFVDGNRTPLLSTIYDVSISFGLYCLNNWSYYIHRHILLYI